MILSELFLVGSGKIQNLKYKQSNVICFWCHFKWKKLKSKQINKELKDTN